MLLNIITAHNSTLLIYRSPDDIIPARMKVCIFTDYNYSHSSQHIRILQLCIISATIRSTNYHSEFSFTHSNTASCAAQTLAIMNDTRWTPNTDDVAG